MVKSYGVVAHVILVSALGPNTSFFLLGGTFIQLWGLLEQGLGLRFGPGLNENQLKQMCEQSRRRLYRL